MTDFNAPSWTAVGLSAVLVVLALVLTARERLEVTRDVAMAAVRAAVQLAIVGAVLLVLFRHAGIPGSLAWIILMVAIAGQVAGHRGRHIPHGRVIATASMALATTIPLGTLLALQIIPLRAEVMVPMAGMIVTGAMQATGLALLRLREEASASRDRIEARLCLAQPAHEAFAPHRRSVARAALLPAVDATKVVGLISLPGAMTGLILAGVSPMLAIRYQIVVMYMLLAAATIAALVATRVAERTLFDDAHRLRLRAPIDGKPA